MVQNILCKLFLFIPSSWTSYYYICCRDKNDQEAQRPVETKE